MVWDPPLTPNAWLRWEAAARLIPGDARDILEIGCGQGGFGARLARQHRYVGIEPDLTSFEVARARVGDAGEVRHGDVSVVGADERFDLICAFEVIEHVENDVETLAAWAGHLRPGGSVLLSAPAWRRRFAAADRMVGHVRRYDPEDAAVLLERAGLEDVRVELFGAPLGFALEALRNAIGRAHHVSGRSSSREERTAASGRLLRIPPGLAAAGVYGAVMPFAKLQHLFRGRGPGVLAVGRRPSQSNSST